MEKIVERPISPAEVYDALQKKTVGSVVVHYAIVRPSTDGKSTTAIEFKQVGNGEEELRAIAGELREKWDVEDVLILRRIGKLDIGEIISVVAVSSPHRNDAFDACRHAIERLKKMRTIKKEETFA